MLILAIESSCDETAAAVVSMDDAVGERKILSNAVASQVQTHALYGGVVPEIASRAHIEAISSIVAKALNDANVSIENIDAVGVTHSPGLIGSLLVGVNFAKSLAFANNIPLVPVDHIKSHTAAAYFVDNSLKAPFVSLVVSGGHTSIYNVSDPHTYSVIGETRDDAAGEAFDKVGRVLGLPYPGGAEMDKLAALGFEIRAKQNNKEKLSFPSPAISDDTFDFSFSGLKTAVINYIHNIRQKLSLDDKELLTKELSAEIAAAFTESVVSGICVKLSAYFEKNETKQLVVAGGVAANSHLRRGIEEIALKFGIKTFIPPVSLCGDNGAMVGAQTYYEYLAGARAYTELNAYASGETVPNMYN